MGRVWNVPVCQPGNKHELPYRHNWKVQEGLKPRSDMILLMFSKDLRSCEGHRVKNGRQEGTREEAVVGPGGR